MNLLNSSLKPSVLFIITFLVMTLVGIIDFLSGSEISPLLFYLTPMFFIGMHKNSNKKIIIISGLIGGAYWYYAEGNTRVFSSDLILIWNGIARLVIFIFFGLMLHQLKLRFTKLQEMNLKLQTLNVEKNKIIGIAAHDLKNPIGSIKSFTDLLIEDYSKGLNEEVKEIHGYIRQLSSNAFHILGNLLDVSKIESGIIEIVKIKQDYVGFVKNIVVFNQLVANKKDISIEFQSSKEEFYFDFDSNHLSEVINNLLTNAIKFSEKNTVVTVTLDFSDEGSVRTIVSDNGKGIAESEHDKLFKYFQKTSTLPTNGEESTGLGLAISKKIITQHGGNIGFESQKNVGSKFYYDLTI